ncbi:MAG: DUF6498-containing protein [Nonlabens sp.]|nr:DUF6498-containing protein [Nonlabens sp.]
MLKAIFYPNSRNRTIYMTNLFVLMLYIGGSVSAATVLFSYFLETIIIGLFNALKMACAHKPNDSKEGYNKLGSILFFFAHYGGFVAIQSIFAFAFVSISGVKNMEPFDLPTNYALVIQQENMWLLLLTLCITHGYNFVMVYIKEERFMEVSPMEIMFAPYLRIFVQQFVVILAGFFLFFEQESVAVVILLVVRTVVDIFIVEIRKESPVLDYAVAKLQRPKEWDDETFRKHIKSITE